MVFLMQAPLLFITCLPAQLGIWASATMSHAAGPLAWAGAAIALAGIAFESVGDAQLNAFRRDPANKGRVLDTGLWRYTRHPNYFGDALTWWGLWLIAADIGPWVALASVIGPLFLTFTLTKWSGKALLEKGAAAGTDGLHKCVLPAYDPCIKASHRFNLLDARGAISVTERASYIARVRTRAKRCCETWLERAA